jgi:hypothetical protein
MARNRRKRWDFQGFGANLMPNAEGNLGNVGLDMVLPAVPTWAVWKPDFLVLKTHAVEFRYPGRSATVADAEHAARICTQVRQAIRAALKLPT